MPIQKTHIDLMGPTKKNECQKAIVKSESHKCISDSTKRFEHPPEKDDKEKSLYDMTSKQTNPCKFSSFVCSSIKAQCFILMCTNITYLFTCNWAWKLFGKIWLFESLPFCFFIESLLVHFVKWKQARMYANQRNSCAHQLPLSRLSMTVKWGRRVFCNFQPTVYICPIDYRFNSSNLLGISQLQQQISLIGLDFLKKVCYITIR